MRAMMRIISGDALRMADPNWRTSTVEVCQARYWLFTLVAAVGSALPAFELARVVELAVALAEPEFELARFEPASRVARRTFASAPGPSRCSYSHRWGRALRRASARSS